MAVPAFLARRWLMFRKVALVLVLGLLVSAGLASAKPVVSFSFASDDHHEGPTVTGFDSSFGGVILANLVTDLNDDASGGLVIFPTEAYLGFYDVRKHRVERCGSHYLHTWKVSGRLDFIHRDALAFLPLLTMGFVEGTLTSISPDVDRLGETATLQVSESVDALTQIYPQSLLNAVLAVSGLTPITSSEDLAFTFTNLRKTDGSQDRPRLDAVTGLPVDEWKAEGSFSASGKP
jgi:hypothetical protein